jgi:hypothetical protein
MAKVVSILLLHMALIVINMLNEFIITKYSFAGVDLEKDNNSLVLRQEYSFNKMKEWISKDQIKWNYFHETVQQTFNEYRVRNSINTRSLNFSFELSININGEEGLYVHIHPRFQLFGFLFCSYKQKTETPITVDKGVIRDDLSYFPFNLEQIKTAIQLTIIINQHYPDLIKIDPIIAMTPIKRSEYINENGIDILSNIDLYQALLSQSHENVF